MEKNIIVNSRKIGDGQPAYIIAEIGLNHNNSVDIAKDLIDKAVSAGCDAVKFQTYGLNARVSNKVKSANYADKTIGQEESIGEMFNRLRLDEDKHKEVFKYARSKNIEGKKLKKEEIEYLIQNNDSIEKILKKLNINANDIKIISNNLKQKKLTNIYAGRTLLLLSLIHI